MKYFLLVSIYCFSNLVSAKTVALLGQWHLLSKQNTLNIKESKKLPQYINQSAIYLILDEWIQQDKIKVVLAEGCSGDINEKYPSTFNGWNYHLLNKNSKLENYKDIMTLIPLKIEVKFKDKVQTICADDLDLITEHQKIFSDLKGYSGFYMRIKESKSPGAYISALEESEKRKIKKPLIFLKQKILELIDLEEKFIIKRNKSFIQKISSLSNDKIALIIGYRHLPHLKSALKKLNISVLAPEILDSTIPRKDLVSKFKEYFK